MQYGVTAEHAFRSHRQTAVCRVPIFGSPFLVNVQPSAACKRKISTKNGAHNIVAALIGPLEGALDVDVPVPSHVAFGDNTHRRDEASSAGTSCAGLRA